MSRVFLKVKLKSLTAEAKIIRKEESRHKDLRESLYFHRKGVVGVESRHTMLAYGFLRGRTYHQIENNSKSKECIDWSKVKQMVTRYGGKEKLPEFELWIEESKKEINES